MLEDIKELKEMNSLTCCQLSQVRESLLNNKDKGLCGYFAYFKSKWLEEHNIPYRVIVYNTRDMMRYIYDTMENNYIFNCDIRKLGIAHISVVREGDNYPDQWLGFPIGCVSTDFNDFLPFLQYKIWCYNIEDYELDIIKNIVYGEEEKRGTSY